MSQSTEARGNNARRNFIIALLIEQSSSHAAFNFVLKRFDLNVSLFKNDCVLTASALMQGRLFIYTVCQMLWSNVQLLEI